MEGLSPFAFESAGRPEQKLNDFAERDSEYLLELADTARPGEGPESVDDRKYAAAIKVYLEVTERLHRESGQDRDLVYYPSGRVFERAAEVAAEPAFRTREEEGVSRYLSRSDELQFGDHEVGDLRVSEDGESGQTLSDVLRKRVDGANDLRQIVEQRVQAQ